MKKLLTILTLLLSIHAFSTNYYFAANGNDANAGTSAAPWQTIAKFNSVFASKLSGDQFLFNRGDVFYGSMIISRSGAAGAPITIGAYGSGANPVITGFTNVVAWTNLGGNIWESTFAVSSLPTCNMVVINGVNTAMGRWPNTGFLTYQSSTATSITSSSLNASVTDWSGAEAVVKKDRYIINRDVITSTSGQTLNFTNDGYNGQAGWGFFIQNDVRTLDAQNEWYYNPSTNKIRIYSSATPSNVQLSTVDTLVYMVFKNYITFSNISFSGANKIGINIYASHDISIQSCSIQNCYNAIVGQQIGSAGASNNFSFQNSTINNTQNTGIDIPNEFTNAIITNNIIKNSGALVGMSGSGEGKGQAINVSGDGSLIQYNEVDTSGYIGIGFAGNNVTVSNNLVNYFCFIKDDGAGIYTGQPYNGRIIQNNIVINGIGAGAGTTSPTANRAYGIYPDDYSNGIQILNNSTCNAGHAGIFLHANSNDIIIGNTDFNSDNSLLIVNYIDTCHSIASMANNNFVAKQSSQSVFNFTNYSAANYNNFDNNVYARPVDDNIVLSVQPSSYTLPGWQNYSLRDAHSKKSPKSITDTSQLQFYYNATTANTTIALNAKYIDVKGNQYNGGTLTLAPYTSVVLINNGSLTVTNVPPVAHAGGDQTITLPTNSVTLNGSGTDVDGTIASYLWTQISGPNTGAISAGHSAVTTLSGLIAGTYLMQLSVADNLNAIGLDTMQVIVRPANILPVANAGSNISITLPTNSVNLNGSGTDADGTIVSYAWIKISGPSCTIGSPSAASTSIVGMSTSGVYTFQLMVTDNSGGTATATVTVTVNIASNILPVANAGLDATIPLPVTSTTLSGSGTDADGTIAAYAWTKISGPACSIVSPGAATTLITGLSTIGTYIFQLMVTDNSGGTAIDTVVITVVKGQLIIRKHNWHIYF